MRVLIIGLGHTNGGRFTTFAGGLPIKNSKGEVLGAVCSSNTHFLSSDMVIDLEPDWCEYGITI